MEEPGELGGGVGTDVATAPALAHAFGAGPEYRLGVEEELVLVDPASGEPLPAGDGVLALAPDAGRVEPGLLRCQLEIGSRPLRTAGEVRDELRRLRGAVAAAAAEAGAVVAAAGTHPFAVAEDVGVTPSPRFRELVAALRYPLRRELCFAMHAHVSVGSPDKAIAVLEGLVPSLPLLVAVSASSPFWRGEATGLASTRLTISSAVPRTGLPPVLGSWPEYAEAVAELVRAGAIPHERHLWWDARPHPRLGTVEVRILDAQPRVEDAGALAGLVQALVRYHGRRFDRGVHAPAASRLIAAENRWLASRHGLRATLVDPESGEPRPARGLVLDLLERVADDAVALGGAWALDAVARIVREGSAADRQLRAHRRGLPLPELVAELARETVA